MYDIIIEKCGEERHEMKAVASITKDGINVYVGGGEKAHIGSIVISKPRPSLKGDGSISCTTSVHNLVGHKDDGIAVPMAESICKRTGRVVVVTAGIHIEGAMQEDIRIFKENGVKLTEKLLKRALCDS
ncbi:MAG: hypothetical protein GX759_01350 [Thermoanaerobacterales bacterium]|jgi:hypothetical protein|nr:hypothetical protein [Thermoanaerobacterales bacterium]